MPESTWPTDDVARQVAALAPLDKPNPLALPGDSSFVEQMVREIVSRETVLLEEACRTALLRGIGVLVVPGYTPMATEMVPRWEIYSFPSLDAVRRWIENGCPHA